MLSHDNNQNNHASKLILGDARFRYHPLWEVERNDTFCYLCEAYWEAGGDYPLVEDELLSEFEDPGRVLSLDLKTLHQALAQVEEVAAQYGVMKVLIPVHFNTLANLESAETYILECSKLVWQVIDDVYFEIIRPPASVSMEKLSKAAKQIASFGQGILLRVEPGFNQFDQVLSDVFISVGMNLREDPRVEEDIFAELIQFSRKARQYRLQTYVYVLESVTLSAAAISSGFDFIGSEAIAKHLEKDEHGVNDAQAADFLKTMLNSKKDT